MWRLSNGLSRMAFASSETALHYDMEIHAPRKNDFINIDFETQTNGTGTVDVGTQTTPSLEVDSIRLSSGDGELTLRTSNEAERIGVDAVAREHKL